MHEIETIAFANAVPWHGLGVRLAEPMTTAQALHAAKLDWKVKKSPVQTVMTNPNGREFTITSDEYFAVVRNKDKKILGIVGKDYKEFQNEECFDFMDNVLGDFGKVRYETAMSLRGGRIVCMLAKLTELEYEVLNGDVMKNYILLSTSHDGSSAVIVGHTDVRVVCANTRSLALQGIKNSEAGYLKVRHEGNLADKMEEAQKVLGLLTEAVAKTKEVNKWLARQQVDTKYINEFVDTLFPLKGEVNTKRSEQTQKSIKMLIEMGKGTDIKGVRGTRWGLLNSVSEFYSHHKEFRDMSKTSGSTPQENKMWSLWFADGRKMAGEALNYLTDKKTKKAVVKV